MPPVNSKQPNDPASQLEATQRPEQVKPVQPVVPIQAVEPDAPVQYVQPVLPVQPIQYVTPVDAADYRLQRAARAIYSAFGIIELLILIRILLRLFAANPDAPFSQFIATLSLPFVAPFLGVFPAPGGHGSALELSSILAILMYMLLAWIIARGLRLLQHRNPPTPS
jgi:uncharacterized protein YggT (Ycf19 family)